MGGGIAHFLLHANEIARQQKGQDLPAAVTQGLETKRPARAQGEQRRIGLPLMDQGVTRHHGHLAPLQRLHQVQLLGGVVQKQGKWPQRAVRAANVGHVFLSCKHRSKVCLRVSFDILTVRPTAYIAPLCQPHTLFWSLI